ncbi:hypothetical protein [Candidatus Chazhemtobacterium aquaticus]|jgi:uncharacterized membrane protein HdeD (DUF308 family)|nr:hypothetical protein [Candidatus Chazhemtobacterium aquaticus]
MKAWTMFLAVVLMVAVFLLSIGESAGLWIISMIFLAEGVVDLMASKRLPEDPGKGVEALGWLLIVVSLLYPATQVLAILIL